MCAVRAFGFFKRIGRRHRAPIIFGNRKKSESNEIVTRSLLASCDLWPRLSTRRGYVTRAGRGERIAQKNKKKNEKKIDFVAESQQPHIIMLSLRHQIVDEMSGLFEPFLIYIA